MKHKQVMTVNFRNEYLEDEYTLSQHDMSTYGTGWVKVCEVEVEYESPNDFNPVAAQVETLKAQEAELVRQFTNKLQEIKEQISKLECLTA